MQKPNFRPNYDLLEGIMKYLPVGEAVSIMSKTSHAWRYQHRP
jgi:hypothetical protein